MSRLLSTIAREIHQDWVKMSPYAKPYVQAMASCNLITERYFNDTAEDVVLRFLANAGTWRGETARRIKDELKGMLKCK